MTVRSLLRLVAGLALALVVAMSWATPSEAHAGHAKPAATTQKADVEQAATYAASRRTAKAAEQVADAGAADCGGHMNENGADTTSCCSNTCHAAMSADMAMVRAVAVAATILPAPPAPAERSGPTSHLKRPPRSSAAPVG